MSKRSKPLGKKIKPQIWVFCEGETEKAYVEFLRAKYRLPIEIESRISGSSISSRYISQCKKSKPAHPKDLDFLLYDADVPAVLQRLQSIKEATLLLSNPAIELWFLLHFKNQTAALSSEQCERDLNRRTGFIKGTINTKLGRKLEECVVQACEKAKKLPENQNPSSNVYIFIEKLDQIKREP
ncbi:MAG: RloB family protein [Bacteroidia bacterium]